MAGKAAQWQKLRTNLSQYRVGTCVGGVQPRLEINDLAMNETQYNLFLLALESLMSEVTVDDQFPLRKRDLDRDFLSFFHIAAIHGMPAVDWGDVPQTWWFKHLKDRAMLKPDWWDTAPRAFAERPNDDEFKVGSVDGGYCVHGSPQFLIWHRPYLSLLEQMIQVTAKHFADECLDPARKAEWQRAAEQLRLPYWDFCRPNRGGANGYRDPANLWYGLPIPVSVKYVRVMRPNANAYVNILNPLHTYTYPSDAKILAAFPNNPPGKVGDEGAGKKFLEVTRKLVRDTTGPAYTARWPTNAPRPLSQNAVLENKASQTVDVQRMRVYYTLTNQLSFIQLSTSVPVVDQKVQLPPFGSGGYSTSLENIHDDYHLSMIGGSSETSPTTQKHTGVDTASPGVAPGGGTLTPPTTAGFEPGFWLMHGFYEYTMCLWQSIHHADTDWWPANEKYQRLTNNVNWMRRNSLEGPDTPLLPFKLPNGFKRRRRDQHNFWTPTNARDYLQFGYTYPECPISPLTELTADQKTQFARRATQRVNTLYGWMYAASPHSAVRTAFLAGPSGQKLFAEDGMPVWAPGTIVDASKLAALQPLRNFTTMAWYPVPVMGHIMSDVTTLADLQIPPPPPPPVVVKALRKSMSTAASAGPKASMSDFRLSDNLRADFLHSAAASPSTDARSSKPRAVTSTRNTSLKVEGATPVIPQANTSLKTEGVSPVTSKAAPPPQPPEPTRTLIPPTPCLDKSGTTRHWNLHYEVDRFALAGTFTIHVFIGDFNPDISVWDTEPSHIHTSVVWVRSLYDADGTETACSNCHRLARENGKYGDWVPLTLKLAAFIASGEEGAPGTGLRLGSMDPEEVVPFLVRNLHWRVVSKEGVEFKREETPGLKVWVTSRTVKMPEKVTELPVWGEWEEHIDITDGRPSGVCHPATAGGGNSHVH